MFTRIKELFQPINPFEKKLRECSLLSNDYSLVLDDLLFIIDVFERKIQFENLILSPKQYMHIYFEIIGKEMYSSTYQKRMKILLTIHLILNEFSIGSLFAEIFLSYKVKWFDKELNQVKDQILLQYYQYLQKMAANISVYHACKVQQFPLQSQGDNYIDTGQKLVWLFKIQNILNSVLGAYDMIISAIKENHEDNLMKEMMLVYWNDVIILYNFLSRELMDMFDFFKKFSRESCFQFYELTIQQLKIKDKIQLMFDSRGHFDRDNVIKQPKLFRISKEFQQQLENHIWKLKMDFMGSRTERNSLKKKQFEINMGWQTQRASERPKITLITSNSKEKSLTHRKREETQDEYEVSNIRFKKKQQ